ncbi:acyltransferase [Plantactinospora sp. GCM10030261]|uniref:acyltransferase family protein n=1 Tax=Plantactinospora sp. GCM10030261 TaxID=3273420 RepID=UPI00360DBAD6
MRNRYIDLLRFLAILRVVVYHTLGWAFLSVVFPAMSVMFALAGSLMAASLDRCGPEPVRAAGTAMQRRLRRLLPSLWMFAALLVPAMLLTGLAVNWRLALWLVPVADPPSNGWGALATSTIWYLRDYLWFVLASPVALWLFRRWPVPTLLAPYVLLVVVEFGYPSAPSALRAFGLYFGAWLLGFAHHDGMLHRMSRRVLVPVALALAAGGLGWIYTHPGPRGFDLNDIPLGNGLWSAGFILLTLGLAPTSAAWVDRSAWFGRVVTVVNRRALTVYLWHMPIVIGLAMVAVRLGWDLNTWPGAIRQLSLVVALVILAVLLFGWVEDLAAQRRPALLPGGGTARARSPVVRSGGETVPGPRTVGVPRPRAVAEDSPDLSALLRDGRDSPLASARVSRR